MSGLIAVSVLALPTVSARAQGAPAAPVAPTTGNGDVRIRRLDGAATETPEYELKRQADKAEIKQWYQLSAYYETTRLEWTDQLDFTYYVLIKTKDAKEPYALLKGTISYINIERGSHISTMFIAPSTLKRYGAPERIAVVIDSGGRPMAMESRPKATTRWWEQLTPKDGLVLPPMQTPFAMLNFDNYEAVKAPANP
jgi:hypothetical protein